MKITIFIIITLAGLKSIYVDWMKINIITKPSKVWKLNISTQTSLTNFINLYIGETSAYNLYFEMECKRVL